MSLIDTHCHIDLYENPHHILHKIAEQGVFTVAVTNLPSHFVLGTPHVRTARYVRLALGMHPLLVDKHTASELRIFEKHVESTSFIGEVGLDYSKEGRSTAAQQIESFRFVLSHIKNRPRFITIHSRKAETEVLSLLADYRVSNAIFHWYSGPLTFIDNIVTTGNYFSINPAMVRSKKGRATIERIPLHRVLTETDGPYITIGAKVAIPSDVTIVLEQLARIWSMSMNEAKQQVYNNFQAVIAPIVNWNKVNNETSSI